MRTRTHTLALTLIAFGIAGCATKKDVDRLNLELAALHARQDSLASGVRDLQESLAAALDEQRELTLAMRGDVRRQLDDMERQLVEIQELLGQSQMALRNMRERIENREWRQPEAAQGAPSDTAQAPGAATGERDGDARALYGAAIEQLRREAYNTARAGFEEFLETHPAHELAPDAQFYLAETYQEDAEPARAIREYRRVVELYPNSGRAPTALYKAGLLQVEQGNKDSACQYFQRIEAAYPRSDEARLARDQAQRLSCR